MHQILDQFFEKLKNNEVELYNEFSFQHELGIFLRSHYPDQKIQFERNVSSFQLEKTEFEKKEIDISVFTDKNLTGVIELKYPRNGQVPETIYSFCKDIAFLEQLISAGFKSAYFIAIVDSPLFYSGNSNGIYGYFRSQKPITGIIQKPTGSKDTHVTIKGSYIAKWQPINKDSKYCVIKIHS